MLLTLLLSGACSSTASPRSAASRASSSESLSASASVPRPTAAGVAGIVNPVVRNRADPFIERADDGTYYFTASVPAYDRIVLRRSRTLAGLGIAAEVTIWRAPASGPLSGWVWAPEIHHIDRSWYIYFSASDRSDLGGTHRMYAMHTTDPDPMAAHWTMDGLLHTQWESFALDETTFVHRGVRYLAWAQKDPRIPGNSNLYIARMSSPTAIAGSQVMISKPDLPWEQIGFLVNEAPAVIEHGAYIFMTYSASATDANYAMGLLTAAADADLLKASSWSKSPIPVFRTSAATRVYGPGSNTFAPSEDGRETLLVFSARDYATPRPNPLDDPNRHTRMQPITWSATGRPVFGVPVANGPLPR